MWIIKKLKDRYGVSFKFDLTERSLEKLNETMNYMDILDSEKQSFNVLPVLTKEGEVSDYFLVFRMRSVHLLYAKNGSEIPLVQMLTVGDQDRISGGFIQGRIPQVELHYFESVMDLKGKKINKRTYNIFKMQEDFWDVIENVQGCPPISQKKIIKRGKQFQKLKQENEALIAQNKALEEKNQALEEKDQIIKALEEKIKELEATKDSKGERHRLNILFKLP